MMEMATWKRGYEQLPDVRGVEKELGESRKNTSVLWKYLAVGSIPVLCCIILLLAIFAGVLSVGIVILHERCPPAQIPVVNGYYIPLDMSPQAAYSWANRSATMNAFNNYLQALSTNRSLVYTNAYQSLQVQFNHNTNQIYNLIYHQQYFDTPNQVSPPCLLHRTNWTIAHSNAICFFLGLGRSWCISSRTNVCIIDRKWTPSERNDNP